MKKTIVSLVVLCFGFLSVAPVTAASEVYLPWSNGKLVVSGNHHYLQQANGTPFFWQGETGWLMPERLNRDEVAYYLDHCQADGYNVVQVQTIDGVPAINAYGQFPMPDGFNFKDINKKGVYGYWDHMDYIIKTAEHNGIYIGMVCIWGNLVKAGLMNIAQAKAYGKFLAERYKDYPNIIWIIGGDIPGDVDTDIWNTLAETIKSLDKNHLMTYHPRGRTMSSIWFNNSDWLDFNMFQSGHRRYGQCTKDQSCLFGLDTEEDNWRYVKASLAMSPVKPVIDGEPSYEGIPQGLHDPAQKRWQACDVRRYAYWSVFAGAFGHTYGNNSIMQFMHPGVNPAYGATESWWDAMKDSGFSQMKYLKNLMLTFPFFERVPDQSLIAGKNGLHYEQVLATRGNDYLLVYNYFGSSMQIDLSKISGAKKNAWWYNPQSGALNYIGEFDSKVTTFYPEGSYQGGSDRVLIAVDSSKNYVHKDWTILPDVQPQKQ